MSPMTTAAPSSIEGSDGQRIAVPAGWSSIQGADGRRVPVPAGWGSIEGANGRRIPVAPGWRTIEGRDGQRIAVPPGWTSVEGNNGRRVALPPRATWLHGTNNNPVVLSSDSRQIKAGELLLAVMEAGMLISGPQGAVWIAHRPALQNRPTVSDRLSVEQKWDAILLFLYRHKGTFCLVRDFVPYAVDVTMREMEMYTAKLVTDGRIEAKPAEAGIADTALGITLDGLLFVEKDSYASPGTPISPAA